MNLHTLQYGRFFSDLDEDLANSVCVIGTGIRDELFGSPEETGREIVPIGETILINDQPFTIVGITPPGFFGVAVGLSPDVTIPVTMLPRLRSDEESALVRSGRSWLLIMGRLRPGLSIARADAAFQPVWKQALEATQDPGASDSWRKRYLTFTSGLEPAAGQGARPCSSRPKPRPIRRP